MNPRTTGFFFVLLSLVLAPVAARAAAPPKEDGVHLRLKSGDTVKLPRFPVKPCDVNTAGVPFEIVKGESKVKFFYAPASALARIPVVSSGAVQEGYLVSREEKVEGLRDLVLLAPYLDGRKIQAGAYKEGCAPGEIGEPADFIAFSAWGWLFDQVIRATFVDESTTLLSLLSRLPLEAGETRSLVGPKDVKIGSFGLYVVTDRFYYPFLPDARLAGFLANAVEESRGSGLAPHVLELASMLEKHLEQSREPVDVAVWDAVASVYREAGLNQKARSIYSERILPKVRASGDEKLIKEYRERYQKLSGDRVKQ
jgi:hypothetical protein